MRMKLAFCLTIAVVLAGGVYPTQIETATSFVVFAQETAPLQAADEAKARPTPTPKAAPAGPLELTKEEIAAVQPIFQALRPYQEEMLRASQEMLAAVRKEDRYAAADRVCLAAERMKPLEAKYNEWLAGAQKAHNCAGCILEGLKLVKPAAAPAGNQQ